MRVLVCPTAFKGSIGAADAAGALARGVRRRLPEAAVRETPLSDGGPGLIDALRARDASGCLEGVGVRGPLSEPVRARIFWTREAALPPAASASEGEGVAEGDVAVLESADACGIHLVPEGGADALRAHTRGVGELIRSALSRGAARVVVGLGGSATTDGGTGMARAFGYRFLDAEGKPLPPGGGALARLGRIEPGRAPGRPITALADVTTPMSGSAGAARTFGPQKGATPDELERLVAGLERLSECLERDLGHEGVGDRPGSGAAGGLGGGLAAFLGAGIVPGAEWVLEATGFRAALADADLVVTGEGAYDATSREGKIVGRVVELARGAGVPCALVCGDVAGGLPEGVRAEHGEGRRLEAEDLADLAARAVAAEVEG